MLDLIIDYIGYDNTLVGVAFLSGFATACVINKGRVIFWTARKLVRQIKYFFRF